MEEEDPMSPESLTGPKQQIDQKVKKKKKKERDSSSLNLAHETQQETMMIGRVEVYHHGAPHPGKIELEIADEILLMLS
jgi:hypothetical protein